MGELSSGEDAGAPPHASTTSINAINTINLDEETENLFMWVKVWAIASQMERWVESESHADLAHIPILQERLKS